MRRPGGDLLEEVSESAMYRLGQAISGCLSVLTRTIEAGAASGDFRVEDPRLLANMLYASGLGTLQLGRVAMLVSEEAPGVPRISRVTARAGARPHGHHRARGRRRRARALSRGDDAQRERCLARAKQNRPYAAMPRRDRDQQHLAEGLLAARSAAPGRARRTSWPRG